MALDQQLAEASLLQRRGQYARAARVLIAARRAAAALGPAEEAAAWAALGVLRKAQGRYPDAERCYGHALRLLGGRADRGMRADLCHNLAGIAHARGRLAEAERHGRRGLRLRPPSQSEARAADRAALATILEARGKRAEAERLLLAALAYHRRHHGKRSYEAAADLGSLGVLRRNVGRLAEAERCFREALGIERRLLGPRHPELAITLNNLAMVLAGRGALAEAVRCLRRALAILTRTVGPRHPHHRVCRANLTRLQPK